VLCGEQAPDKQRKSKSNPAPRKPHGTENARRQGTKKKNTGVLEISIASSSSSVAAKPLMYLV
jgi:hypothetical protein